MEKIKEKIKKIPGSAKLYLSPKKSMAYLKFISDYRSFKKKSGDAIQWKNRSPRLGDNTTNTHFSRHYIYHPAWAARIISKINPKKHIDISSTLHFSTIVSAFIHIDFYDYRPAKLNLTNITSKHANLLSLDFPNNSIKSLSCMHTIEHIGLGRYGDEINPKGDIKAFSELERVLAPEGDLLIVVPIGKPKILFNAHRIYSYKQVLNALPKLKLKEFSLIPDKNFNNDIIYNTSEEIANKQKYGCGCFWFTKI